MLEGSVRGLSRHRVDIVNMLDALLKSTHIQDCDEMFQGGHFRNMKHRVKYLYHSHITQNILIARCANYKQLLALRIQIVTFLNAE